MTEITFLAGIVLALVAGIALAVWFLHLRETPGAAREESVRALESAARPVTDALERMEARLRELEASRQHMQGGLDQQLTQLSRETVALSKALRVPNARGRWGELTLRRVAELSGMSGFCDFSEQESSGSMRPDMIVRLPGGRTLAVDAKAPLAGYLDAEGAQDEASRNAGLERHAQQIARHVLQLSAREYWTQFQPAPDLVVLFLPGDHFLSAALEKEPELLERSIARRVLIATPVTLISVLKGAAFGWKQERLAKNAEELRKIAGEFHDRARAFAAYYADSGHHLAKAMEAYNRSVASWESRLQPSIRRMRELGVGGTAEVPELPNLDAAVRDPQRTEQPLTGEPQA